MDFIQEFLHYIQELGFEPKGGKIISDNKWHQAKATGDTGNWFSGTYSMKIVDADFAIGCCFSRKDPDTKYNWHSKTGEKLTPEERKRINREIKAKQKAKELTEARYQERIANRLTKYCKALPKATEHPYLKNKGIAPHGAKYRKKTGELILPCRKIDGKVWTIQKINKVGGKYLFIGGRKKGSYIAFAKKGDDFSIMAVCEGFATGASIREATGLVTISAIDSGNLKPVLKDLKKKYPDTRFIICADNDIFTRNAKGELWNVGKIKADEAAASIGGAYVCLPRFTDTENYRRSKYSDYNDVHALEGLAEVKKQIEEIINKIPSKSSISSDVADGQEATGELETSSVPDQQLSGGDFIPSNPNEVYDYDAVEAVKNTAIQGDFDMDYKILGYNKGTYYYFPFKERQIVALSASAHTIQNLFRLDSLENWMDKFGNKETSEKKVVMYAGNALIQAAKNKGVFKEEDKVRGSGAWIDQGKKVLNCGNRLYVNGKNLKFDEFDSDYTYVASVKIASPSKDILTTKEAFALRQICEAVTWENKLSGSLLAGWLVIAPICGALSFRPHIYITGESESGKSTVMDKIIRAVLGKISINVDGGTTEPAIREMMEHDARPLVYDEAESKESSMQAVIALARKASSGGMVKKFGQGLMKVRFCACFSAINPPVNQTADESRISFMTIKKNKRPTAMQEYEELLEMIEKTITKDFPNRLLARTLANIDVLFQNIKVFQKAARIVIKGARASQVIGTMIAGLYLLSKTDVVTLDVAKEWIEKYEWSDHTMIEDQTEPIRVIQHLSSCLLKLTSGGVTREISIGDLIEQNKQGTDLLADKLLRYNGIAVKDGKVHIAGRSANLGRLFKNTDWSIKWTPMLANIEGAEKFSKPFYFGVGFRTSGVSIPLSVFLEHEEIIDEIEIPF